MHVCIGLICHMTHVYRYAESRARGLLHEDNCGVSYSLLIAHEQTQFCTFNFLIKISHTAACAFVFDFQFSVSGS